MALRSVSTLLETVGAAAWRADALACASGAVLSSGHAELDAQLPGGGWPVGALCEILQTLPGQHEWRLLLPALRQLLQAPSASGAARAMPDRASARQVVLVGAPAVPQAPATRLTPFAPGLAAQGLPAQVLLWVRADSLAERLWVAEQALRCSGVAALLLWLHDAPGRTAAARVRADHLRRLHLGAQAQAKLLFVMRPASARGESSPAVLRLLLQSALPAASAQHAAPLSLPTRRSPTLPELSATADDDLFVQILKRRGPPLTHTLRLPARHAALAALLALGHKLAPEQMPAPMAEPRLASACAPLSSPLPEVNHALDRAAAAA